MKKGTLISTLHSIQQLQAIPENERTERQQSSLNKLRVSVGSSYLMKKSQGTLPDWLKQSDAKTKEILRQFSGCVEYVPAKQRAQYKA